MVTSENSSLVISRYALIQLLSKEENWALEELIELFMGLNILYEVLSLVLIDNLDELIKRSMNDSDEASPDQVESYYRESVRLILEKIIEKCSISQARFFGDSKTKIDYYVEAISGLSAEELAEIIDALKSRFFSDRDKGAEVIGGQKFSVFGLLEIGDIYEVNKEILKVEYLRKTSPLEFKGMGLYESLKGVVAVFHEILNHTNKTEGELKITKLRFEVMEIVGDYLEKHKNINPKTVALLIEDEKLKEFYISIVEEMSLKVGNNMKKIERINILQ
jgi:hypothetical protein